jgi:hypothetical protein
VQCWRLCKHDAAWAGMGATMEVTRGKAIAAAKPILRTATRRERYSTGTFGSTSRLAFANWSRASRTTDSSTRADTSVGLAVINSISVHVDNGDHVGSIVANEAEQFPSLE